MGIRPQGIDSDFKGFDKSTILHSELKNLDLFRRYKFLQKYDLSNVIIEKYIPLIQKGMPTKERIRFMHFVIDNLNILKGKRCISKLKTVPIFPDERNNLYTFDELYFLEEDLKKAFDTTLKYPSDSLLKNPTFMSVFKFKNKITEDNIIQRAKDINPVNPDIKKMDSINFENYLLKRRISDKLLLQLKLIFYVLDTNNNLVKISDAYEYSKYLRNLVGIDNIHYIKKQNISLFRRLGLRTMPRFNDLINYIKQCHDQNKPILDVQNYYIELARAVEREKIPSSEYSEMEIIYVAGKYYLPKKIFVNPSKEFKKEFGDFWIYIEKCTKTLKECLIKLGCIEKTICEDYRELLKKIAQKSQELTPDIFKNQYCKKIYAIYEKLNLKNIPFEEQDEIILTEKGSMVSIRRAKEQLVVLNDNESIKNELDSIGILFADPGSIEGEVFLRLIGVRRTSEIFYPDHIEIIGESKEIGSHDVNVVNTLKKKIFIKAINAILSTKFKNKTELIKRDWEENLKKITGIKFCNEIIASYNINGIEITGNEECYIKDGCIYILNQLKKERMQKISLMILKIILEVNDETLDFQYTIQQLLIGPIKKCLSDLKIFSSKKISYKGKKGVLPSPEGKTGLIDPESITPSTVKPKRAGGGGSGGGGGWGGGGRPPQNHATDYDVTCTWIKNETKGICQACAIICDECRKSRSEGKCDCVLNDEVHGPTDIHHLEGFVNNPERDKKGNLILVCKYHHKILDRINFKLGFKMGKFRKEEKDDSVIITLFPQLLGGDAIRIQFTKQHFNLVEIYMKQ